jgi:hypothetical protein
MAIDDSTEDKKPLLDETEALKPPSQTTTSAISTEQATAQLQSERKFTNFLIILLAHSYLPISHYYYF